MSKFTYWFFRIVFFIAFIFGIILVAGWFFRQAVNAPLVYDFYKNAQQATVAIIDRNPIPEPFSPIFSESETIEPKQINKSAIVKPVPQKTETHISPPPKFIAEVKQPRYYDPPTQFSQIGETVNSALVNIVCSTNSATNVPGITGSGVIVDPRGLILTNAHVAQSVLLKDFPSKNSAKCAIRTGAPARTAFMGEVVVFPHAWAEKHIGEFRKQRPLGTGENDWALILITEKVNNSNTLSSVVADPRHGIFIKDDPVLIAGYPAGFYDNTIISSNLWPISTIGAIKEIFTFKQGGSDDLISLGGVIVAQSGISGSPVMNAWNRLIGIAVTASEADETKNRDLRAVSMAHINESIKQETGFNFDEFLAQDLSIVISHGNRTRDEIISILTKQ